MNENREEEGYPAPRRVTIRPTEDGGLLIHVPMVFRKRYGRKLILAAEGLDGANPQAHAPEQERLVVALARAYTWKRMLDEGKFDSLKTLAVALDKDSSYIARILRLATLAPDIAKAIVEGREPNGLSFAQVAKALPLEWEEQRRVLGFREE
jgi:hypothetical protein